MTIEPMKEGDVDAVVAIDEEAFGTVDTSGERGRRFREELARPWARLWVARGPSGVEGYLLAWHVVDEAQLLDVAVARRARRSGVGRALVSELVAYARGHGVAKILLEVRASNAAALALYEGLGFARFHVRKRYYADGEDGVELVLALAGA